MTSIDRAIRFACAHCDVELEMPGDAAGEEVDCPECDQVLIVPSVVAAGRALLPSERERDEIRETADQYGSQLRVGTCAVCGASIADNIAICHVCGTPTSIDLTAMRHRPRGIFVGEIMTTASKIFVLRLGTLIPLILFEAFVAILLYSCLMTAVILGMQQRLAVVAVCGVVITYCIYHALHVSHFEATLGLVRGDPALRTRGPRGSRLGTALKMISVSTIFWTAVAFGLILAVAPAIVFAVLAWPCGRIVADRNVAAGTAISQAIDLTAPHWPGVLAITAMLAALNAGIGLVAVGVGQVIVPLLVFCVVLPFSSLVLTVTYLRLSDEPTVVDASPGS